MGRVDAAAVRFGVLGPLQAERDGRAIRLGGLRQRAVLAVLLIARGRMVPAERIMSDVWEGSTLPSPTTLHAYVSELRRALEPEREARAPSGLLVREGPGYALRADPSGVDAERFADLAVAGRRALTGGRPGAAEELLSEALELWRGPAYADFAGTGFALSEAARLEGQRAAAYEDRLAAAIDLGRHAAAIGELEALVAEQPLRERGWELLALALYRSGRQADAGAALRAIRRRLADELGIDPGPGLRDLESAVLAQDPRLDPRLDPPPARAADTTGTTTVFQTDPAAEARRPAPTGNLPFALSSFVGRTEDMAAVRGLLADFRLVTLTGPGGVGKTRLALETARGRTGDDDGPWLVELAGLTSPELLPATIATTLGIPGAATTEAVAAVLAGRRLLLVLDNCEHLLDATSALTGVLLSRCGGLRVLATSREPLGVEGEAVYEVPPLDPAGDGTELFRSRVAAAVPAWTPDPGDIDRIPRLCAGLDGIPLAIELAAAQCRMLSVGQIADALENRFDVLVDGPLDLPARHRALEATVAWSHQLLEPEEQLLFHRLSVFAAGFDLDAAGAVGARTPVLPSLSALVRKSLVSVEPGTAPRRYRLLETLRQYALRGLDPDDLSQTQGRHRAWALAQAESAERRLHGPQAAELLARLTREQPEFRAAFASALAAGDGDYALRLGGALYWFWYRMGHIAEGLSWMSRSLAAAPDAEPAVRARARLAVSGLSYLAGRPTQAYEAVVMAEQEAQEAGDMIVEASARVYQTHFGVLAGIPLDAPALARSGVELARRAGEDWLIAEALMVQGMLARVMGDLPAAAAVLAEAVATADSCGHDWAAGSSAWAGMKTACDRGDGRRALEIAAGILDALDRHEDVTSRLVLMHTAAHALVLTGQAEQAAVLMGGVDAVGRRVGFSPELMDPLDGPREAAAVRDALTPDRYERLAAQGRELSLPELTAFLIVRLAEYSRRTGSDT
ncbi:winged helix-turn-helix domain-containing protein [Planotetraspora sp. A-T 1434]|uniref:AfsR/SARP family transcriptional regulator n=1 Tax=Planotetraspora sp. A-T 1434 TaxID=2979219 RepID=UPI0021C06AD4|nr:BTAD domain-containing putative transcriptional regulator [Planotetraspora sp. A-T 1434]MCT9933764.1 winged helix-turn-helix domain-containing protein [Planotetraspora sp. A-T 1434]